ncbi:MAG TPA: hypothetical protein ENI64_13515, partial [Gammaproteobacteria bacterium]|nr:hypothetical protein [Gammaproteobacteria bacterium]
MMQSLSVRTLLIATILLIVWPAYAANNITRDVGEIAIIEADTNIIYTATDTNGNPCPQVTVNKKELAKKFYQTHSDDFQFLIMYTNFDYLISPKTDCSNRAAALHNLVSNSITGIGRNTVDNSALYGSSGVLESFLSMSNVNGWQVDPTAHILVGNNSMLSLLGQEAGHRWLAFVQFDLPGPGITASNALLGRANSHWSFFHHATSA